MKALEYWFEYYKDWHCAAPLAYWVHIEQDGKPWRDSEHYKPPAPKAVLHKGYPILCFSVLDCTLRFSSTAELSEFIHVLSMNPLPTSKRLSELRGTGYGPNNHWLSRLPTQLKSTKNRPKVVKLAKRILHNMESVEKFWSRNT